MITDLGRTNMGQNVFLIYVTIGVVVSIIIHLTIMHIAAHPDKHSHETISNSQTATALPFLLFTTIVVVTWPMIVIGTVQNMIARRGKLK
jgi:uncharacterized membrane protein YdjX (TVP38/TMEM64 family)